MGKTIFVIGANSTLAQAIIPVLNKDYTIITGGRNGCDVYCDVTKEVKIPEGVDAVINFAAHFGGKSESDLIETIETNTIGLLRVCQAAKDRGIVHVVHISTIFAAMDIDSAYAITKRQGDELADYYAKNNQIPLAIIRPSRIYGDSHIFSKGQPFLYKLLELTKNGEDVSIYGNHNARRNYIHSDDIAHIIQGVISYKIAGIYNCTSPEEASYVEIIESMYKTFKTQGKIVFMKNKPNVQDDNFPFDDELYRAIHFSPKINITEGIKRLGKMYERGKNS